jgi:pyruvate dehydrogenase E1 component alpha subunit
VIEQFDPLKGQMLGIIDESGRVNKALEPRLSKDLLRHIYSLMVLTREADEKSLKLQRQGRMGTFAQSLGHEACQIGTALTLTTGDWFFPYFRDLGSYLTVGYDLKNHFLYWKGSEKGVNIPEDLNMFPLAVPVASQCPHSVGAGMALKQKGEKRAVLTILGDGATSEGDFHESLNFAGVFGTPNVFVCYNNQWAISMPRSRQTASQTLAQKALAYGFPGLLVDGNDVLAVYAATKEAMDKARKGGGPTFIEAYTYRLSDHTTSDDAAKYRNREELDLWWTKDPILRFRAYLTQKKIWDEDFEQKVLTEAREKIDRAVKEAEGTPLPSVEELFRYTYQDLPPELVSQMEELKSRLDEEKRT